MHWSWPDATRAAACAAPALPLLLAGGPKISLTWAVGCLPLVVAGPPGNPGQRRRALVVSALVGMSILVGSILVQTDVTAVLGIFAVALGAAVLASRAGAHGAVVLSMCLPVCAVGMSYDDIGEAAGLSLVFVVCALFSGAVLRLWPPTPDAPHVPVPTLSPVAARRYGVLIGLAGATSTLLSIVIGTDHVGWAPAAGYFVVRPAPEVQRARSIGRLLSVIVGAGIAVTFLRAGPADPLIALFGIVAIAAAGATRASRWYVTPLFGSALVLTLLLFDDPTTANERWRFDQRVTATIIGVGVAWFFAIVVPALLERRTHRGRLGSGP